MIVIAHQELTSSAASITFSDIPATFTDLVLQVSHRSTGSTDGSQIVMRFNGSASGYSRKLLYANGSSVYSSGGSSETYVRFSFVQASSSTANTFGSSTIYIPNYTSSSAKSFSSDSVNEINATNIFGQAIYAGLWSGTAAISSITIFEQDSISFAQYSSATLYGILAGSDGSTTVS